MTGILAAFVLVLFCVVLYALYVALWRPPEIRDKTSLEIMEEWQIEIDQCKLEIGLALLPVISSLVDRAAQVVDEMQIRAMKWDK